MSTFLLGSCLEEFVRLIAPGNMFMFSELTSSNSFHFFGAGAQNKSGVTALSYANYKTITLSPIIIIILLLLKNY